MLNLEEVRQLALCSKYFYNVLIYMIKDSYYKETFRDLLKSTKLELEANP